MKKIKVIACQGLTVTVFLADGKVLFECTNLGEERLTIELFEGRDPFRSVLLDILGYSRSDVIFAPIMANLKGVEQEDGKFVIPQNKVSQLAFCLMKLDSFLLILGGREFGAQIKFGEKCGVRLMEKTP